MLNNGFAELLFDFVMIGQMRLEELVKKVSADAAAVMVPHPTEQYLYCKDSFNCPPEWAPLTNPLDNTTANGRVFLSGKPEFGDHVNVNLVGHLISSVIIVPVTKDGKVVANLEVIISDEHKSFPDRSLNVIEGFAKSLARNW